MKATDLEFCNDDYGKIWGVILYYPNGARRVETLHLALCCEVTKDIRKHIEYVIEHGKTNFGTKLYRVKTDQGYIGNGINGRVDDYSEAYVYRQKDAKFIAASYNAEIEYSHTN